MGNRRENKILKITTSSLEIWDSTLCFKESLSGRVFLGASLEHRDQIMHEINVDKMSTIILFEMSPCTSVSHVTCTLTVWPGSFLLRQYTLIRSSSFLSSICVWSLPSVLHCICFWFAIYGREIHSTPYLGNPWIGFWEDLEAALGSSGLPVLCPSPSLVTCDSLTGSGTGILQATTEKG